MAYIINDGDNEKQDAKDPKIPKYLNVLPHSNLIEKLINFAKVPLLPAVSGWKAISIQL